MDACCWLVVLTDRVTYGTRYYLHTAHHSAPSRLGASSWRPWRAAPASSAATTEYHTIIKGRWVGRRGCVSLHGHFSFFPKREWVWGASGSGREIKASPSSPTPKGRERESHSSDRKLVSVVICVLEATPSMAVSFTSGWREEVGTQTKPRW